MAHAHIVSDSDNHFIIDPISRQLSNNSKKTILIKTDHNSEQFTFELPRYVEGHDMSLCDKVEVHFLNINSKTRQTNPGIYNVVDFDIDAEDNNKVLGTWLISREATKYPGSLNFVIRFACMTDDNVEYYSWNTAIYTGITISDTIENTETIVEDYVDIFRQWLDALELAAGSSDVYAITDDGIITNLCEQINGLDSHVTELEGQITGFGDQVTNFSNQVTNFGNRVSGIEQDVSTFKEEVNTEIAGIENNVNTNLSTLRAEVDDKLRTVPNMTDIPFVSYGLSKGTPTSISNQSRPATTLSAGRYYIEGKYRRTDLLIAGRTVHHIIDFDGKNGVSVSGIGTVVGTALSVNIAYYCFYVMQISASGQFSLNTYLPKANAENPYELDFDSEEETDDYFYYKKLS